MPETAERLARQVLESCRGDLGNADKILAQAIREAEQEARQEEREAAAVIVETFGPESWVKEQLHGRGLSDHAIDLAAATVGTLVPVIAAAIRERGET